jgi:hypothetical protein
MAGEPQAEAAAPTRWKKVKATRIADLGLPPETAEDLLGEGHDSLAEAPPEAVITRLAQTEDQAITAVRLLAFALPKREAVWWACLASRADIAADPKPTRPADTACLEAAEAWVYKPVEERRLACYRAALATKTDRPASMAALAAAFSSGSLAPPDSPPEVQAVAPDDSLTAQIVGNAVVMAAVRTDPAQASRHLTRLLDQGCDIARGGNGAL